jgi:hypothetical protein
VADLSLLGATVVRYQDSFFALRAQVDALLESTQPPHLLVYVPLKQDDCHNALVELEVAGVVLRPGQQPPARNTRLSVIARNALKAVLNDDAIAAIEKQIDAGKLTLADLDRLASTGEAVGKGVLALILGTRNPRDVALAFLASDGHDAEIAQKDAGDELAGVLAAACGIMPPASESLAEWRARLARYILATDFAVHLAGKVPPQYELQVAHYLAVTDLSYAYIACLLAGQHLVYQRLERDQELIDMLYRRESEFWHCVETDTPPTVDSSEATTEALQLIYARSQRTEIHLPAEAQALVTQYRSAAVQERDWATQKRAASNQLKALMGENEIGITGPPEDEVRVYWTMTKRGRTFTIKFREE